MFSLKLTTLLFVLASTHASAQTDLRSRIRPITGKVKNAGTLHLGTGTWTRPSSGTEQATLSTIVYANTCSTGYYAGMTQGEIFVDEGGIPNRQQPSLQSSTIPGAYDANPGCADSYEITGFQIGYCTYSLGFNYATDITFYDQIGPAGVNCPVPGAPTATFHLTGLPGDSGSTQMCWLVSIDLTATTPASTFTLTGTGGTQGDIFGWSFTQVSPSLTATPDGVIFAGGPGSTSPALCSGTDATRWDNGTASIAFPNNYVPSGSFPHALEEGTGMFNLAAFRIDGTTTASAGPGCYWFGGDLRGSWFLEVYSDVACCADCGGSGNVYCFGDGTTATACPCGNFGAPGAGCNNSIGNGGASLSASGAASLSQDTLKFTQVNELGSSLSIFLQGTTNLPNGVVFGDGVRCLGGTIHRMYVKAASGGTVMAPIVGTDPSVSARSAALGDPLVPGVSRFYGVYYRDPSPTFCPSPAGNTWNIGNGYQVLWNQ